MSQKLRELGLVEAGEPTCEEVQDRIVATLNLGEELNGQSWRTHERNCEACRAFLLRTERARAHYQAPEPTSAELKRLRLRLASNRPSSGSNEGRWKKRIAGVLAGALGLGATGAFAAGWWPGTASEVPPSPVTEKSGEIAERAVPRKPSARNKDELAREADKESEPSSQAQPLLEKVDVGAAQETRSIVSPKASKSPRDSKVRAETPNRAEQAAEGERRKWADAAEALRKENQAEADAALRDLSESENVNTRERAQLGLAQLWIDQGKKKEAEDLLRKLTKSQSAFVRTRAQQLLDSTAH